MALDSNINLTTKIKVKTFMGLDCTDTSVDPRLDLIINGVSSQVAQICDRTFKLTAYKLWLDGSGRNHLRLPHYPITALYGVSIDVVGVGTAQYTGSGAFASAQFNDNAETFTLVDISSSGAETIKDIDTSGMTIAELSTSINAQSNWSWSTQDSMSAFLASHIKPFVGQAKSPSDADFYSADIQNMMDSRLSAEAEDVIESRLSGFPMGNSNVWVWFKAGYTLPTESSGVDGGSVPQGLENVVNMIVRDVFRASCKDGSLKSEKLGDYSYTLDAGAMNEAVKRYSSELHPWMKKRI